jgi:hypothetical protein
VDKLARLHGLARVFDTVFRIPFTRVRFGLDAILGLVPGIGDVAGAVASAYIMFEAARLGAPGAILLRMLLNVGVEALVGLVPVLGDLFDVSWKANVKNVELLEQHLERPGTTKAASQRFLIALGGLVVLLLVGTLVLSVVLLRTLVELLGR